MHNFSTEINYYQILGISKDANQSEIKKAYFKLAHVYHPDKNKSKFAEEKFKLILSAYEILSNEETKSEYDFFLLNHTDISREAFMKREQEIVDKMQSHYFQNNDLLEIDQLLFSNWSKDKFTKYLNSLDDTKLIVSYTYFWNSFWEGKVLCKEMINKSTLLNFYKCFLSELKNRKIILRKKFVENNDLINEDELENIRWEYSQSLIAINKGSKILPLDIAYEYMIDIIDNNTNFDRILFTCLSQELNKHIKEFLGRIIFLNKRYLKKKKTTKK